MRSVLVALRQPAVRESVQRDLEDAGYLTYTAGKAASSLMVLHMCPHKLLVLLDAQLPMEGAAERLLLRRYENHALVRHQYILCADRGLGSITPRLAQLAAAQGVPVLRMPFADGALLYVLEHGTVPPQHSTLPPQRGTFPPRRYPNDGPSTRLR